MSRGGIRIRPQKHSRQKSFNGFINVVVVDSLLVRTTNKAMAAAAVKLLGG